MTRRTSSGPRSRQSGIRCGSSGSGTGAGPEPVPAPEYLNPGPDGRDLGPENEIPVSGFPLSAGSFCSTEPLGLRASRISSPSPSPSPSPVLTFALLHRPQADLHLCTVCLHPLSTCQLASMSPRACACPLVPVPTCRPRDLWSRRGSAIQEYGLTPCSTKEK